MEPVLFVFMLCFSVILATIFLICRVKYGYLAGVFTKILASFGFVVFGLFMFFTKIQPSYLTKLVICFILLGLICGLIGDVLLDLKVIYPFHDDKYLKAGMVAFGVGHIFYISALLILAVAESNFFDYWIEILSIVGGAVVLCFLTWLISTKILKLNFGNNTLITNCYSFILILTTAISIYMCFLGMGNKMIIIAVGFCLFLISDLILSTQYFGGKQENKTLIILNHTFYYLAQILIASFIYFV